MTALSITSDAAETMVSVKDVTVTYKMSSVRYNTLKEMVLARLSGKHRSVVNNALTSVSLDVKRGQCVAFVGHNGCGKSTLLKVIAGILKPKAGTVTTVGRVAPLIELGAGFDPELTGRENVYLSCSLMGLTRREIDQKIGDIYAFSELGRFFDASVKTYSSGMYMRLGFSCSVAIDADVLLIDEILAVGDANFQQKCLNRMTEIRKSGATIILVSHDMNIVKQMADHVLVLDGGEAVFEGKARDAAVFYDTLMSEKRRLSINPYDDKISDQRDQILAHLKQTVQRGRILDGKIRCEGGEMTVIAGKPWSLEIEFELYQDFLEPVCVGFAVHDFRDIRVGGGNSNEFKTKLSIPPISQVPLTKKGVHRIVFEFLGSNFASGSYHLFLALHDHQIDQALDLVNRGYTFAAKNLADPINRDHDLINFSSLTSGLQIS